MVAHYKSTRFYHHYRKNIRDTEANEYLPALKYENIETKSPS